MKLDTCPVNFRKVLKIIRRHSTFMISNDTQSQQNIRFRSITDCFNVFLWENKILFNLNLTDCFYCVIVEENKIFFKLIYILFYIFFLRKKKKILSVLPPPTQTFSHQVFMSFGV